jgi:hypothetical protein
MPKTMPSVVNLPASVADGGTLRLEIEVGFRAPVRDGNVTIESMWRADLYEIRPGPNGRRPKFLGTFVTHSTKEQTPADLLRQLADIYEAGELRLGSAMP